MSDGGGFDLSKLAVGDEVGIESDAVGGISPDQEVVLETRQSVGVVAAIHDNGVVELVGDEWFDQDGRCIHNPKYRRLVAPTDQGRRNALYESIGADLACLRDMTHAMGLPELRRLRAALVGLIAGT